MAALKPLGFLPCHENYRPCGKPFPPNSRTCRIVDLAELEMKYPDMVWNLYADLTYGYK
jgi:hypothetical protein